MAPSVAPIVCYPSDRRQDKEAEAAVWEALREIQGWLAARLEGPTFHLRPVYGVSLSKPIADYGYQGSGNVGKELVERGVIIPAMLNTRERGDAYVVWVFDQDTLKMYGKRDISEWAPGAKRSNPEDGYGGGVSFHSESGIWLLRYLAPSPVAPWWVDERREVVGAVAHELFHEMGLADRHEPEVRDFTLMGSFWPWPDGWQEYWLVGQRFGWGGLLNSERSRLKESGFLH